MTDRQTEKQNMFFPSFRKEERDVGHDISEFWKELISYIEIFDYDVPQTSIPLNGDLVIILGGIIGFILGAVVLGYLTIIRRQKSKTSHSTNFTPTSSAYYCGICMQKHIAGTPRMQCTSCGRSICVDQYSNMTKVGKKGCPMCDGKLESTD